MNINNFHYFIATAREKSFTKAARDLHISQQTLSANIKSLEDELNCQLFVRKTPLELTEAGEVFLIYAKKFEELMYSLNNDFDMLFKQTSQIMHVGISQTRERIVMPLIMKQFQKIYPNIHFEIMNGSDEEIKAGLLRKELDLGIGNFDASHPKLHIRQFYSEDIKIIIPDSLLAKQKKTFDQLNEDSIFSGLEGLPFLIQNNSDVTQRIIHKLFTDFGLDITVSTRAENIETLLSLCILGAGCCFCAESTLMTTLTSKELKNLKILSLKQLGALASDDISIAWHKKPSSGSLSRNPKIIRDFIEIAQSTCYPKKE